jgi:ABC-2 type transport system ATP-binding protein
LPALSKQGHGVVAYHHYEEAETLAAGVLPCVTQSGPGGGGADSTSELLKKATSGVLPSDRCCPLNCLTKRSITGRVVQFPANDALEIENYLAAVRQAGLIAQDVTRPFPIWKTSSSKQINTGAQTLQTDKVRRMTS